MDLSSVVQEAQNPAAAGDTVELRLLWVVSRIAHSSEELSPGVVVKERLNIDKQ